MPRPAPRLVAALPALLVADPRASIAHYRQVFGYRDEGVFGCEPHLFGMVSFAGEQGLHFKQAVPPPARPAANGEEPPLDAYVRLAGPLVAPLHAHLVSRGARVLGPPRDRPWQQREFLVADPDGHVLCFGGDLTGEWPATAMTLSPELAVRDPEVTLAFFRDALGFPEGRTWGDPPRYAILGRDAVRLHARRAGTGEGRSNRTSAGIWDVYVKCTGVDDLAGEFQRRGVPLERGPMTTVYGMREFEVLDPDGHAVCFGEPAGG